MQSLHEALDVLVGLKQDNVTDELPAEGWQAAAVEPERTELGEARQDAVPHVAVHARGALNALDWRNGWWRNVGSYSWSFHNSWVYLCSVI